MPLDQDSLANAGALEGRQRLNGAFLIELRRIRPDPDQPRRRLDTQAQLELSASVEKLGILQPITVRYLERENIFQIISGERRYHAAKGLGLSPIPCWIKTPKAQDILLHQIAENWQRRDLEPLELAQALGILRDSTKGSQKDLAAMTGKPESEISRLLSLLRVEPEVQRKVQENRETSTFTKRHLAAIAQLPPDQQLLAAQEVENKQLSAIDTERLVQKAKSRTAGRPGRGAPLTQRFRYLTDKASVTLTFRRRNITKNDILEALSQVSRQVVSDDSTRKR